MEQKVDQENMRRLTDAIEKLGNKFDIFSSDFSNRLTKIETMFSMFDKAQDNLSNKVDDVEKVAHDALISTKSAHKRLDDVDDDMVNITAITEHGKRLDKLERIVFWAGTTIIGGVILGLIGFFFSLVKT